MQQTISPTNHPILPTRKIKHNFLHEKNFCQLKDMTHLRKKRPIFHNATFQISEISFQQALIFTRTNKTKHIQNLTFHSCDGNNENLSNLSYLYRSLKSANGCTLHVQRGHEGSLKWFTKIFKSKLKSASLYFQAQRHFKCNVNFKSARLKSLKLSGPANPLQIIRKNVVNIPSLISLEVHANKYYETEEDFMAFCSILSNIKRLEKIVVLINGLENGFDKEGLSSLCTAHLFSSLNNNTNLKSLTLQILGFDGYKAVITDVAAKLLGKSLKSTRHPKLEKLDLELSVYDKFNEKHLDIFSNRIKDLLTITELSLVFSPVSVMTEASLVDFGSAINKLINLRKLTLTLPIVILSPIWIVNILHNILEYPIQVDIVIRRTFTYRHKESKTYFKGLGNLEDSFLCIFEDGLLREKMLRIKDLVLDFSCASTISSQALAVFARSLLEFSEMKSMSIILPARDNQDANDSEDDDTSLHLDINEEKKIVLQGGDREIALFIGGLIPILANSNQLSKVKVDFSKMSPLEGDALLSISDLFENIGHVGERVVIFAKIEPNVNSKFKVTSAIAKILQSGGDLVLGNDSKDLDNKNSIFNSLRNPDESQNIKTIDLKFRANDIVPYLTFDVLKRNTSRLTHLENLNLDIANCTDFGSKEDFVTLKLFINEFKSLATLNINLRECDSSQAPQEFHEFVSAIRGLKYLKSLSLDFEKSKEMNDMILEAIGDGLSMLVNLQSLYLNFKGCGRISDKGATGLGKGIAALKNLVSLNLNFNECNKITDKGFGDLILATKQMENLNTICVGFRKCPMLCDIAILSLYEAFTSIKAVEKIELNFEECGRITNEGISKLFSTFLSFPNLHYIDLNFAWNKNVSDFTLEDICNILTKVKSLIYISLNFHWCYKVSDEGLSHIVKLLQTSNPLSCLKLTFKGCLMISDKSIAGIAAGLYHSSRESLEHLQLNFGECSKASNQGLQALGQLFKHANKLKCLDLDFNKCSQISDQGVIALLTGVYSLQNIETLYLDFNWGTKVNGGVWSEFVAGLPVLSNLEKLKIFSQSYNIDVEDKQSLQTELVKRKGDKVSPKNSNTHRPY